MADKAASLKVFVSYSRVDVAFADQLVLALEDKGFVAILDRHDISGAENWRERLGKLILSADAVAFVLTAHSAASEICSWEVNEAVRLGKRVVPLTPEALNDAKPPAALAELNWIPFYADPAIPGSGFYFGVKRIVEALSVDLDWLRAQTRYSERALEWSKDRRDDLLLRGEALKEAEAWVARTPARARPLDMVREYLAASGDAEQNRQAAAKAQLEEREQALKAAEAAVADSRRAQQRLRTFSLWALLAGVLLLAIAIPGNYFAATRTLDANDRRAALFASAANDLSRQGDHTRALLMALAGDPPARVGLLEDLMRPDGNMAVRNALARAYASDRTVATFDTGMENPRLVAMPYGKRFLTLSGVPRTEMRLWTAEPNATPRKFELPRAAEDIFPLEDNETVLVWWAGNGEKAFSVWSLADGRIVRDFGPAVTSSEYMEPKAAIGVGAAWIAHASNTELTVWNIIDGVQVAIQPVPDVGSDEVTALAVSEDEQRVTVALSGTVAVWDVEENKLLKPVESVFGDIGALTLADSSEVIFGSDRSQLGSVDEEGILTSGLQAFADDLNGQSVTGLSMAGKRGLIVVSSSGRMQVLDTASGSWVEPFGRRSDLHDARYLQAAGMIVGVTRDGTVLLTAFGPMVEPKYIGREIGDEARGVTFGLMRAFSASPSGPIAIETEDRRLLVWDPVLETVDAYPAPADLDRPAANLAVSVDGGTVFRSAGHVVDVWKRGSAAPNVLTVSTETDIIASLQALGDGGAFTFVTFGGKAGVLRSDTGEPIIGPVELNATTAIASPDGQVMVRIDDNGEVGIIRAGETRWGVLRKAGNISSRNRAADTRALAAAFSPDGGVLAIGLRNGALELWRTGQTEPFKSMRGHIGPVSLIAFQPDGKLLASLGGDGRALVWDQGESDPLQLFDIGESYARSLAFPPGGREILVVEEERLFRFPVSPILHAGVDEQVKLACERLQARGVAGFSDRDVLDYPFLDRDKSKRDPCVVLGLRKPAAETAEAPALP